MIFTEQIHTLRSLYSLPEVPTPVQAKNKWEGVPHAALADALVSECERLNLSPGGFVAHVENGGRDMVCGVGVNLPVREGVAGLAVVNDHSWKSALWLYGGVLLPDRGIPLLRVQVGRHVKNFDPEKKMLAALEKVVDDWGHVKKDVETLQKRRMPVEEARLILQRSVLGRSPVTCRERAETVLLLFKREEKTAWSLLNCFCEVNIQAPVLFQMKTGFLFCRSLLG